MGDTFVRGKRMGPCALDGGCVLSAGHGDHCQRSDGTVILRKRSNHLDVIADLGRKMEAIAVEGAQQPNHTFRAIAGKAPDCPVPGGCDNPHCRLPAAAPVTAGLAMHGRWRVYFNKHGRSDLPWCIAPDGGGWEIAVPSVLITTDATTAYQPKATPDDEDGRPSAWIAVEGVLTVAGGRASIAASAAPEVQTP